MAFQVTESADQGFRALTLDNGLLSVTVLPELGGKISSLFDHRNGREWLWRSPELPYRRLPYGTSYVAEADTGGWDECFPTVAACRYPLAPWTGLPVPDHGELWSQAWKTRLDHDPSGAVVRSEVGGVALPYTFRRRLRLRRDSETLRLEYEVANRGDTDLAFIWSAHPLFAVTPGTRVRLPEDARLHSYLSVPPTEPVGEAPLSWPVNVSTGGQMLSLAEMPERAAGLALKLWSEPLSGGWAALEADDGVLRFAFDPAQVPQLGLWVNAGGWSGTGGEPPYNLALEPCIGAQDSLEEAVTRFRQHATLPPGGSRAWWLAVTLSAARKDTP